MSCVFKVWLHAVLMQVTHVSYFSAGDLYVKDYFDPLVKEGQTELRPLRVYYLHRWVQTVNPTVLEYCLVGNEGTTGAMFRKPTKADVEKHRIVVATLSTSRYLFSLDLPPGKDMFILSQILFV